MLTFLISQLVGAQECFDKAIETYPKTDQACLKYSGMGYCTNPGHVPWMKKYCQRTCNFCTGIVFIYHFIKILIFCYSYFIFILQSCVSYFLSKSRICHDIHFFSLLFNMSVSYFVAFVIYKLVYTLSFPI